MLRNTLLQVAGERKSYENKPPLKAALGDLHLYLYMVLTERTKCP